MANVNVEAPVPGSVWTHSVGVGQIVTAGTVVVIMECMKSEIPVETPCDGEVTWLRPCGDTVSVGDVVAIVQAR